MRQTNSLLEYRSRKITRHAFLLLLSVEPGANSVRAFAWCITNVFQLGLCKKERHARARARRVSPFIYTACNITTQSRSMQARTFTSYLATCDENQFDKLRNVEVGFFHTRELLRQFDNCLNKDVRVSSVSFEVNE